MRFLKDTSVSTASSLRIYPENVAHLVFFLMEVKKKKKVVYLYKVLENCASMYYGSTHAYFSVISLFCYTFFDHYMLVRLPFVLPV